MLDDRSFDWTGIRRVRAITPTGPNAVTISSQFGVTAADARDEPLGRAGPWTEVRARIDRAYGPGRVLHVSLEELPGPGPPPSSPRSGGGSPAGRSANGDGGAARRFPAGRWPSSSVSTGSSAPSIVPNVLALFPTFRRSARFASEFPETVQVGPIWPEAIVRVRGAHRTGALRVLWYASPSTSARLLPRLMEGLSTSPRPVHLRVRSPRPLGLESNPRVKVELLGKESPAAWRNGRATTDLAIVTGSRSLLEAIDGRVPFLYFNGVMGRGSSARRHRPEKLLSLLAILRVAGVASSVRRDLADFARMRRVEDIVRRGARGTAPLGPRLRRTIERAFPDPFQDGGRLIRTVVGRFDSAGSSGADLVAAVRRESRHPGSPGRRRIAS